eukprot:TRINITY_DN114499_c0_g1_i1.p1 TRINITY_DN114499_c0_g1~~TRINITY_DN114499_c0_g1_i1.p1  ORF type:complete len:340 (+),score=114.64 TRINITY_DN114499_c0_g1_i1:181-1200(+)
MVRRGATAACVATGCLLGSLCAPKATDFVVSGAAPLRQPASASSTGSRYAQQALPSFSSTLACTAAGGCAALVAAAAASSRLAAKQQRARCAARVQMCASQDELKKQVGYKAVDDYVKSGTVIGLGTGSTAAFAVERVGELLKNGTLKDIIAIPTSIRTKEQAESLGIPLATLDTHSDLDVAIDGADEVDPQLNLVKGGGGALFREKIVEQCAKKFICIVDESKMCDGLGPGFPVPVEIVPFCHEHTMRVIGGLPALAGCKPVLRLGNVANNKPDGDKPAVTDNGNYIVDLEFTSPLKDAVAAADQLKNTVGVVDHGLFIGMTTACIIAGKDGITVKEA